jgi:hypothetical protein
VKILELVQGAKLYNVQSVRGDHVCNKHIVTKTFTSPQAECYLFCSDEFLLKESRYIYTSRISTEPRKLRTNMLDNTRR